MLLMIRDLITHKGHANRLLLEAIRGESNAATDPEILGLLQHILVANRFWFLKIIGEPFDLERETMPPVSLDELADRYTATQTDEEVWIGRAESGDLEAIVENELIPAGRCTVAQGLIQVCMHSQGHRAQLAKMLRRHGGTPPMTDFILWLSERVGLPDERQKQRPNRLLD
jgi:uncharacterized damage-inducible protein DinB